MSQGVRNYFSRKSIIVLCLVGLLAISLPMAAYAYYEQSNTIQTTVTTETNVVTTLVHGQTIVTTETQYIQPVVVVKNVTSTITESDTTITVTSNSTLSTCTSYVGGSSNC